MRLHRRLAAVLLATALALTGWAGRQPRRPQNHALIIAIGSYNEVKSGVQLARFGRRPRIARTGAAKAPLSGLDRAGYRGYARGNPGCAPDVFRTDFNVFLGNGAIAVTGAHEELLQRSPAYAALVRRHVHEREDRTRG